MSRKTLFVAAALCATAAPTAASAQAAPTWGTGLAVCSSLPQSRFVSSDIIGQYIVGFVSGAIAMSVSGLTYSGNTSGVGKVWDNAADWKVGDIIEGARAYCYNNPSHKLYQAANMMVGVVQND